jgi:uncharacterized membrane protein YdcZ (DUF606 family)
VVGGTSVLGGRGQYVGAVGGAVLLTTLSTIISALGIAEAWRIVIYGLVILLALLLLKEELQGWAERMVRTMTPTRFISPDKLLEGQVSGAAEERSNTNQRSLL